MTEKSILRGRYGFGPFLLDADRRLVWQGESLVVLTPKTVEVLCVLVARRGTVVEKADLLQAAWPDTFVEENNLARHVSILRKALCERKGQHDYISTIPGHGYMFVSAVSELPIKAQPLSHHTTTVEAFPAPNLAHEPAPPEPALEPGPGSESGRDGKPHASAGTVIAAPLTNLRARMAAVAVVCVCAALLLSQPQAVPRPVSRLAQLTFDGGAELSRAVAILPLSGGSEQLLRQETGPSESRFE